MTLKEKIVDNLRNLIIEGEYKPGEHLTEARLCERFGVSRTPVREALNQLETEGFVTITPEAGARVIELTIKDISAIYDVLIVLEGLAGRLGASVFDNLKIDKLEEYHLLMERAAVERNADLLYRLNNQFHWLITESSGNTYLIDMRDNFRSLVDRFARLNPHVPGQIDTTLREHREIIRALKNRNPALTEFLIKEHLEGAKERLLAYLRQLLVSDDS